MKKLTFIDHPKFVPIEEYDKAILRMIEKLKNIPGVLSIYQIGSINDPGISDIDMLVIFKDNSLCHIDPSNGLTKTEKYLFIHNLFGMSLSHFTESQEYSFFHGFNLLYGKELRESGSGISEKDKQNLKQQIALEYLIKMYQTLSIQITYRIIKLRSILLEVKALLFDLEFLKVKEGKLFKLINNCIEMRSHWFSEKYDEKFLDKWIFDFHIELERFLKRELLIKNTKFYFDIAIKYYSSRNVSFKNSKDFGFEHSGFILPGKPAQILGKRFFNLNHKLNRFNFFLPISNINKHKILREKLDFEKESSDYNLKHFSFFFPLKTSLNIYKVS